MQKNWSIALLIFYPLFLLRVPTSAQEIVYPKGTKFSTIWVKVPVGQREKSYYELMDLFVSPYTYAYYRIDGYIYKNEFIDNSPITIFNRDGEEVIEGVYRKGEKKENFVMGTCRFSGEKGTCTLKGTFEIKTHHFNQLFSKRKRTWETFHIVPLRTKISMRYSFSRGEISIQNDSIEIVFNKNKFSIKQISTTTPQNIVSIKDYKNNELSYLKGNNDLYLYLNYEHLAEMDDPIIYFNDGSVLMPQKLHLNWNNGRIVPEGECLYQWENGDRVRAVLTKGNNFFNVYSESKSLFYALLSSSRNYHVDCESSGGKTLSYDKWFEVPQWANDYEWKKRLQTKGSWTDVINKLEEYEKSYKEKQERIQKEEKEKLKQQQEDNKEEEQKYKEYLIQKYGARFAQAIIDERVEIGMTKQMVREATDLVHYDIIYEQGKEIWIFDEEKTIFKKKQRENIYDLTSEQYRFLLVWIKFVQLKFPSQIVFWNGKVIDIIE